MVKRVTPGEASKSRFFLAEWREAKGVTQEQLAERAGTTKATVSRWENSERDPPFNALASIADALGIPLANLFHHPREALVDLAPVPSYLQRVPLAGEVQAGAWRQVDDLAQTEEVMDIPLAPAYRGLRPFALRVVGPSMNLVYPEGTLLICCHLEDLHEQPTPGKRYIIQDRDPDDSVETTVKELVLDDAGRPWAWPRSSHPAHQTPVPLDVGRDGHSIEIHARVVFALKPE